MGAVQPTPLCCCADIDEVYSQRSSVLVKAIARTCKPTRQCHTGHIKVTAVDANMLFRSDNDPSLRCIDPPHLAPPEQSDPFLEILHKAGMHSDRWDVSLSPEWVFDRHSSKQPSMAGCEGYATFVKVTRGVPTAEIQMPVVSASHYVKWAKLAGWGKIINAHVPQIPGHLWVTPMKTLLRGKFLAQKKGYGVRYSLFHNLDWGFFESDLKGYTRPPKAFTPQDIENVLEGKSPHIIKDAWH